MPAREIDGTVLTLRLRDLKIPFSFGMLSSNLTRGTRCQDGLAGHREADRQQGEIDLDGAERYFSANSLSAAGSGLLKPPSTLLGSPCKTPHPNADNMLAAARNFPRGLTGLDGRGARPRFALSAFTFGSFAR
jgi:hypothetical protein